MALHPEDRAAAGEDLDVGRVQRAAADKLHRDIHCVTKWSKFDTNWAGVTIDDMLADAGVGEPPTPYLLAHSFEGYTTNVPLKDLTGGQAMVALS